MTGLHQLLLGKIAQNIFLHRLPDCFDESLLGFLC